MCRLIINALGLLILLNVAFNLSSCKDEESGPPKISFSETEASIPESGDFEVEIRLSSPASEDIEIEYDISGSAKEVSEVVAGQQADYEIEGDIGEIVIPEGASSAVIQLHIVADGTSEDDETIELSIDDVSDESIIISDDDEATSTIENDDEVVQASFTENSSAVVEDEGLLEIAVQLDRVAEDPITVYYTLAGTAIDSISAWNQGQIDEVTYAYDYYIDGVSGEVEIPAGSSSAVIKVQVVSDVYFDFEPGEILITLKPSQGITVNSNADDHTASLLQEDGKLIWLQWDVNYTTVDMDLFLWKKQDGAFEIQTASYYASYSGDDGELVFWPTNFGGGEFGLSHNYYEGDVNPMNFTVKFIDFVSGVAQLADSVTYPGRYTLANVNPWLEPTGIYPPPIAQTYTVTGGVYTINEIVPPAEGSRSATFKYREAIKPRTKSMAKNNMRLLP
jgi:hypothetical protein